MTNKIGKSKLIKAQLIIFKLKKMIHVPFVCKKAIYETWANFWILNIKKLTDQQFEFLKNRTLKYKSNEI